jgi:magnesium transporter
MYAARFGEPISLATMLRILHFQADGSHAEVDPSQFKVKLELPGTLWVDMASPTDQEFEVISQTLGWHPLAIEDCRLETHLPKIDDYKTHVLVILHGLDVKEGSDDFDSKEVEIFIGSNYLVTHHKEPLPVADELIDRAKANPGLAGKGPTYLLFLMLDLMSSKYLPYLDGLDGQIDDVEAALLGRPSRDIAQQIYALKRNVLGLRRVAMPQLEVFRRLGRSEFEVIPPESRMYFLDIYDDLFRITQAADSYRELLTEALNSYLSALSNEMNQVMKVLTVFSSILLPLTFLVGVWGMNFRYMPELFLRHGYLYAWLTMVTVGLLLAWFFKRREWW